MSPRRDDERTFDYMGSCRACKDMFTVFFRAWPDPRREHAWIVRLERSSEIPEVQGKTLFHRCGGEVKLYGPEMVMRLVD